MSTNRDTLEAARRAAADYQRHGQMGDDRARWADYHALRAALDLLARLTAPPDEERERTLATAASDCLCVEDGACGYHQDTNVADDHRYLLTQLTATRARVVEVEADLATERERHRLAWEALCDIGEAVTAAGHYALTPERALRVGWAVGKLIEERDSLRARVVEVEVERDRAVAEREAANFERRLVSEDHLAAEASRERAETERDTLRREVEGLRGALTNADHAEWCRVRVNGYACNCGRTAALGGTDAD